MLDEERGIIRHPEFASQLRDFRGLRFGKITPTDIDGFIEYLDECFVFVEAKHGTAQMPYGQRLAFERLADACSQVRPTVYILASHDAGINENINFADCSVTQYRYGRVWKLQMPRITVREFIDKFFKNGYKPEEL